MGEIDGVRPAAAAANKTRFWLGNERSLRTVCRLCQQVTVENVEDNVDLLNDCSRSEFCHIVSARHKTANLPQWVW